MRTPFLRREAGSLINRTVIAGYLRLVRCRMRSLKSLPSREAGFFEPMEYLAVMKLPHGLAWGLRN
jgi:hypothetical protein